MNGSLSEDDLYPYPSGTTLAMVTYANFNQGNFENIYIFLQTGIWKKSAQNVLDRWIDRWKDG